MDRGGETTGAFCRSESQKQEAKAGYFRPVPEEEQRPSVQNQVPRMARARQSRRRRRHGAKREIAASSLKRSC